jgi:hypothetical protein
VGERQGLMVMEEGQANELIAIDNQLQDDGGPDCYQNNACERRKANFPRISQNQKRNYVLNFDHEPKPITRSEKKKARNITPKREMAKQSRLRRKV